MSDNLYIKNTESEILSIHQDSEALVTIKPDGSMEFGPTYNPDKAAKAFWDAVRRFMPEEFIRESDGGSR